MSSKRAEVLAKNSIKQQQVRSQQQQQQQQQAADKILSQQLHQQSINHQQQQPEAAANNIINNQLRVTRHLFKIQNKYYSEIKKTKKIMLTLCVLSSRKQDDTPAARHVDIQNSLIFEI